MATLPGSRPSPGWVLGLTAVASFMVALDTLVVVTALPAMQRDLRTDIGVLQWVVNAYSLVVAAGVVTGAALGDRLGRRRVFVAGLTIFSLASAACALAPNAAVLVAMRAVQGVGAALTTPVALTIVATAFPERRGTSIGVLAGVAGLAIAGGPLVGGAIAQGLDWHWIFWVNVPIGLATAALAAARLPETHGAATRIDGPAVALVSGGAAAIVGGLAAPDWSGRSAIALGVLLLLAFVAWERRAPEPLLPTRLFRDTRFAAANASAFLTTASVFAAAFLITQYFQIGLHEPPLDAALRFMPMTATPLVVAPLAGALSDRVGRRSVLVAGMLLQALGLAAFAAAASPDAGYERLVVPLLLAGVGASMPLATATAAALGAVAPADLGKASGVTRTVQNFGGVFGVAVATAVFAANGDLASPARYSAGFHPALVAAAGLALVGAAAATFVGGRTMAADPRALALADTETRRTTWVTR